MKVVLDTNVFISAIFWRGTPHKILQLADKKGLLIVSSKETLQELSEVIRRPKFNPYIKQTKMAPASIMEGVVSLSEVVHPTKTISIIKTDPSDNIFLACALSAKASFIISGDRHLLAVKKFHGIPIVTPAQFLKQVKV